MRHIPLVAIALCMAGSVAGAQATKVMWKCAPLGKPTALEVGDAAGHMYVLEQGKCTAVTASVVAGVTQKEGTVTEFADATGDNAKGHGMFVETMSNGDKVNYTFTFTGVSKGGKPVSGSNKWSVVGGTGKFKTAKGSGSCKGTGNPDGSSNYDCVGNITGAAK